MLNSINLDDKSYEDILTEAISQIPLYSEEWTNFNHSDPGITMLQNFSAFALLQQNTINQITDPVRRSLLRLIGFEAAPLRPAHVFAACEGGEAIALPAQWKGRVGDLCFETEQPVLMEPWSVDAVYMKLPGEELRDITFLLGRRIPADTAVFGTHPEAGAALYVGLTGTPRPGATAAFWLQAAGDPNRNPFRAEAPVQFASLRWQAYTASGWKTIPAQDETAAFLQSGAVRLTFPAEPLAVCGELPHPACAIRCVVDAASYDRAPRVQSFMGNLLELVQKETRAACFTFPGGEEAVVRSAMTSYGNEFLCCREEAGGPYYAYRLWTGGATSGRFYTKEEEGGTVRFRFDRERFGFGPAAGEDAILCSFWDDDATYRRSLGTVYGFEGQEIDVDLMENILPESRLPCWRRSPGATAASPTASCDPAARIRMSCATASSPRRARCAFCAPDWAPAGSIWPPAPSRPGGRATSAARTRLSRCCPAACRRMSAYGTLPPGAAVRRRRRWRRCGFALRRLCGAHHGRDGAGLRGDREGCAGLVYPPSQGRARRSGKQREHCRAALLRGAVSRAFACI